MARYAAAARTAEGFAAYLAERLSGGRRLGEAA